MTRLLKNAWALSRKLEASVDKKSQLSKVQSQKGPLSKVRAISKHYQRNSTNAVHLMGHACANMVTVTHMHCTQFLIVYIS